MFIEGLLCIRQCSMSFIYTVSFDPNNNPYSTDEKRKFK